jgi:hypothetical protein
VREHAVGQRYTFLGPVTVAFDQADDLETGVFRVVSGTTRGVPDAAGAHAGEGLHSPAVSHAPAAGPDYPGYPAQGEADWEVRHPGQQPGQDVYGDYRDPGTPAHASPAAEDDPFAFFPPTGPAQPYPGGAGVAGAAAAAAAGPSFSHHVPSAGPEGAAGYAALEFDGQRVGLTKPVTVIGRSSDADLTLDDPGISRRHAEVHLLDGLPRVVDLGSTNGTFVDGERVHASRLGDGSVITIGRTRMIVRFGSR